MATQHGWHLFAAGVPGDSRAKARSVAAAQPILIRYPRCGGVIANLPLLACDVGPVRGRQERVHPSLAHLRHSKHHVRKIEARSLFLALSLSDNIEPPA
jgi:hypothetical protein